MYFLALNIDNSKLIFATNGVIYTKMFDEMIKPIKNNKK